MRGAVEGFEGGGEVALLVVLLLDLPWVGGELEVLLCMFHLSYHIGVCGQLNDFSVEMSGRDEFIGI